MASGKISVTVERAVHDGLRDLAQRVFEQHGVQLHAAQIEWLDISSLGIQREVISSIRISTETKAPNLNSTTPPVA